MFESPRAQTSSSPRRFAPRRELERRYLRLHGAALKP